MGGVGLWTGAPLPLVAGLWNKANVPFHQPCLFIGFKTRGSRTPPFHCRFLCPTWGCCALMVLPPGFPLFQQSRDHAAGLAGMAVRSPLQVVRWAWEPGFGGMLLAAAKATCFRDPPLLFPCLALAANYAFRWWKRNIHLDKPMKLQDQVSPRARMRQASLLSREWCLVLPVGWDVCLPLRTVCERCHWGVLLVGSNGHLTLQTYCVGKLLFGTPYYSSSWQVLCLPVCGCVFHSCAWYLRCLL